MIVTRGLTKRYGKTVAVDGLSFTVPSGVVTGFLGPNGSGKSTTMRMIMGLDVPDAGTATVNGLLYDELRWPLREVGALLDAKAFHPGRTARQHLRCLAKSNDIPEARIDEVLDIVGLTSVADKRAGKFSLGMGQRLGIAGALLGDPGVLLFDEPVNGLDPEGIRWVRHLLRGPGRRGPHRARLEPPHQRDGADGRAPRRHRPGHPHRRDERRGVRGAAPGRGRARRHPDAPAPGLRAVEGRGARPTVAEDGGIVVTGVPSARIGEIAARRPLTLHELTPIRASLEDAFMELTSDSVEYRSHGGTGAASSRPALDRPPTQKGLVVTIALSLPTTDARRHERTVRASARRSSAESSKLASLRSTKLMLGITVARHAARHVPLDERRGASPARVVPATAGTRRTSPWPGSPSGRSPSASSGVLDHLRRVRLGHHALVPGRRAPARDPVRRQGDRPRPLDARRRRDPELRAPSSSARPSSRRAARPTRTSGNPACCGPSSSPAPS